MEINQQHRIQFHGVDIINVQFNSLNRLAPNADFQLSINPKVHYPENEKSMFQIFMEVDLRSKEFFTFSLLAIGYFQIDENDDIRKQLVNQNAPAIMFPYIRAFISTFSSNIGLTTGPLLLPPQFFSGEVPEIIR
jgi:preprotein translocase subunit SecB